MGHRLKTFISNLNLNKDECACRVWWDGEGSSEQEKNASLVLRLSFLVLEAETSVVGVWQWFRVMNLDTKSTYESGDKNICSSFQLSMMVNL